MKVNLNDQITFRLTEHGEEVFAAYPSGQLILKYNQDGDGKYRVELWSFFEAIEPVLGNGMRAVTVDNSFEIEETEAPSAGTKEASR